MDKDRIFWEAVRRALLAFVKAIEVRYLSGVNIDARNKDDVLYSKR